jgi:hypothetical protein
MKGCEGGKGCKGYARQQGGPGAADGRFRRSSPGVRMRPVLWLGVTQDPRTALEHDPTIDGLPEIEGYDFDSSGALPNLSSPSPQVR